MRGQRGESRRSPSPMSRVSPQGGAQQAHTCRCHWTGSDNPRRCGAGHGPNLSRMSACHGQSPHARGESRPRSMHRVPHRTIPAYAGRTYMDRMVPGADRVHPRTCGAKSIAMGSLSYFLGSSPHMRGTFRGVKGRGPLGRFIPARAGQSRPAAWRGPMSRVHPRMCGAKPKCGAESPDVSGSSPHVRGKDLLTCIDTSSIADPGSLSHPGQRGERRAGHAGMAGSPVTASVGRPRASARRSGGHAA